MTRQRFYAGLAIIMTVLISSVVTTPANATSEPIETKIESSGNIVILPAANGQKIAVRIVDPGTKGQQSLSAQIGKALAEKGYKVGADSKSADYILTGRVIYHDECSPEYFEAAYKSRYGTRLTEKDRKPDLIAKSLHFLVNKARGKRHLLIVDVKSQALIKTKRGHTREQSKARIVAGVAGSDRPKEAIDTALEQALINYIVSNF